MNDREWDDYLRRREGTFWGNVARDFDESIKNTPPVIKPQKRAKKNPSQTPNEKNIFKDPIIQPSQSKSSKPFYPGVDRWVEKNLTVETKRVIAIIFMVIGGIIGAGLSDQLGLSTGFSVILGALAGLALLPILIFSVKVILFFMTLTLAGLILYLLYLFISSL